MRRSTASVDEACSTSMVEHACAACVERDRRIDELTEALKKRETAYARLELERTELADAHARLKREHDQLVRRFLRPTTEKIRPDENHPLFPGGTSPSLAASAQPATSTGEPPKAPGNKKKARRGHGRNKLPANLERRERVIEPPDDQLLCACGKHKVVIRHETSEQLERVPATLYVLETIRPVYACPSGCEGAMVCAPAPAAWIERGLGGPGLHAWMLTAKFGDHLPLNRISGILGREGALVSTSTLGDWVKRDTFELAPIYRAMCAEVLASKIVRVDDTSIRVIDEAIRPEGAFNGRVWAYLGTRRGDLFFRFSKTRQNADPEGCHAVLEHFQGTLQADASNGYDALYRSGLILECGCWAHCRRKFYEAQQGGFPEAKHALDLIAKLYQVEREAKLDGLDAEARHALRLERSRPIVDEFFEWVRKAAARAVPKTLLATALGYALNQEAGLRRFLEDGRLELDNNDTERALRHVAIGRKAWLFAGNEDGARSTAVLSTLVYACKDLEIDPVVYLRDVLERLPSHPANRVDELTPRRWLELRKATAPPPG